MSELEESWRPVLGWECQYEVSNQGRVRSLKTHQLIKGCKNAKGYIRVTLPAPNSKRKQVSKMLHHLVLEAFVGLQPENTVGCHGVLGVSDNSLDNLTWATQYQNVKDRVRDGTNNNPRPRARGAGNHRAKLTEEEAKEIIKLMHSCSKTAIASRFGVSPSLISAIHRGKKWAHLPR